MNIKPTHEVQTNILGLIDPDGTWCLIKGFRHNHKKFILGLEPSNNPSQTLQLIFGSVQYLSFKGRTEWLGANVELLPIEESHRMIHKLKMIPADIEAKASPALLDEIAASLCKVYRIRPQDELNEEIIICAAIASLSKK